MHAQQGYHDHRKADFFLNSQAARGVVEVADPHQRREYARSTHQCQWNVYLRHARARGVSNTVICEDIFFGNTHTLLFVAPLIHTVMMTRSYAQAKKVSFMTQKGMHP